MSWGKFLLGLILSVGGASADVITATYVSSSITCSITGVQTVTAENECRISAPNFASSYGSFFGPKGTYDTGNVSVTTGDYSPGAETSAYLYNSILITGGNGSSDPSNGAYLTLEYAYFTRDNRYSSTITLGNTTKTFTADHPDDTSLITTYFQYGVPFDFKVSADVKIDGGGPTDGSGFTRGGFITTLFVVPVPYIPYPAISGGTHTGGVSGNVFVATPEPATPILITAGIGVLFFMRKRRAA